MTYKASCIKLLPQMEDYPDCLQVLARDRIFLPTCISTTNPSQPSQSFLLPMEGILQIMGGNDGIWQNFTGSSDQNEDLNSRTYLFFMRCSDHSFFLVFRPLSWQFRWRYALCSIHILDLSICGTTNHEPEV
ncbi:hypothetical protein Droror1_Dr00013360 [Drosera rotundifolia]